MSAYRIRPTVGSKKMSSNQPFAASGERRMGTTTIIASRTAHSAAKNRFSHSLSSESSAVILKWILNSAAGAIAGRM